MKINGRMKQRIKRLEAEQHTAESSVICVLALPAQEIEKEDHALVSLSGYRTAIQQLTGETAHDFERRAEIEIPNLQEKAGL